MRAYQMLAGSCLFAAFAIFFQVPVQGAQLRLSLKEAVDLARENNYSLKAARARIQQADAKIVQSRQSYLPKVTLSETVLATNDPGTALVLKLQQNIVKASDFNPSRLNNADPINDFNTSLQVLQPIYNPDAAMGRRIAFTARKAEDFMALRAEESITLQVSKVYYGLVLARKNIEAVQQSIETMQGHSREAGKAFRVGLLTKSDKLSVDVRLAELNEQKLMLHDAVKNATDALRVLLNLDPEVSIVPTDGFVIAKGSPSLDHEGVPENRSDLMALQTYREIAGQQIDIEKASRLPKVNGFVRADLHSDDVFSGGSSWTAGVSVQWDIFDGMASAGRIQEAKARELEARYLHEAARIGSLADIRKVVREMRTAKSRVAVARQAIDEARVSLDYIGSQFRTGMAMMTELLMRESAYTYAKLRLNQASHDYCVAKSELDYHKGR